MQIDKLLSFLDINSEEFTFQFQSHPNFPSALAFSDTLNFLGIKNEAYELEKKYWNELPKEFIGIYDNNISLVEKKESSFKIYNNKEIEVTEEELHNRSREIVILFEKSKNDNVLKKSTFHISLFYICFICILIYFFYNNPIYEAIFNAISCIGIYFSIEIFRSKFGENSQILNNVCGGVSRNSSSNCSKIINSDKISIYGLKLSDFSLLYFSTILLMGLFLPSASYIIKGLTYITVAVILYSLYIQVFVEKIICKICLLINCLLITQLFLGLNFKYSSLLFESILLLIFFASIIIILIIYLNENLKKNEKLKSENIKNLKFKRNYNLFKSYLLKNEKLQFLNNSKFIVGNLNAKINIKLITNPYCGFCKDAHILIDELLKKYENQLSIEFRFNFFPEVEAESYSQLMNDFNHIYTTNSSEIFLESIAYWFNSKNETSFRKKYNPSTLIYDLREDVDIAKNNLDLNLSFTPIIILNNYKFPDVYDREDIHYFIDEILEDEDLLNAN